MKFKEIIKNNINKYGYHISVVTSDIQPRYAYTIGLNERLGFELIFAGGIYYMEDEVIEIINSIVEKLETSSPMDLYLLNSYGTFRLSKIHQSWSDLMALGVFDYYKKKDIEFFQVMPDPDHYTVDIPNMISEWKEISEPIWKWLVKEWDYPVSKNSKVVTNINSLRGEKITEVMRWEEDEWEAFVGSGEDVNKDDLRVVSLATILGIDSTFLPVLNLEIGKGLWRDSSELEWHKWN